MFRATTPTHIFIFPPEVKPTEAKTIEISYAQNDKVLFSKGKNDATVSGQTVSLDLTQEEMNRFKEGIALAQVRVKNDLDKVMASQIIKLKVKQVLSAEVL